MIASDFRRSVSRLGVLAVTALALLLPSGAAHAAILLTVNATNPSDIVFTATSGLASGSSSGQGYSIALDGALTAGSIYGNVPNSGYSLKSAEGNDPYFIIGSTGTAINLGATGIEAQTFTSGQVAFTGTASTDLSFLSLNPSSFVGNVEVFDNTGSDTGTSIGQFQFIAASVPEPATASLLILLPLSLLRRRKSTTGTL